VMTFARHARLSCSNSRVSSRMNWVRSAAVVRVGDALPASACDVRKREPREFFRTARVPDSYLRVSRTSSSNRGPGRRPCSRNHS
jgi:hypothetical protein